MQKNKKLLLIGTGELAEIAYEYFTHDSSYEVVGFSVEREFLECNTMHNLPVIAFEDIQTFYPAAEFEVFVAIPSSQLNRLRTRLYQAVKKQGYKCATYISSCAFVWRNAKIGENCFIFENNTIQPFVEIGDNVILWSGNHIGHRTVIEDNCFLSSHVVVSGYCRIGENCFLGVNSTFNDNVTIARDCIIASGALVTKSLSEPERIYFGSPAKKMLDKSSFDVKL